jgi:peptidoglycan/LPS O-acetylase OafA/YrhL
VAENKSSATRDSVQLYPLATYEHIEDILSREQSNYRPDIDGLRALAVLSVVIFHAFPARLPGGFIGVDIFFVISGYLISGIVFTELSTKSFGFTNFYARRIRRIFPALLFILCACAAIGWIVLLPAEYAQLGLHIAASSGFIQNLVLWSERSYFDTLADTKPLLHLWSLGVEEQFYLVWPILLVALTKRRALLWSGMLALAILSLTWSVWSTHSNPTAAFYSPLSRFWELLVGAMLAWRTHLHVNENPSVSTSYRQSNLLTTCGFVLIGCGFIFIDHKSAFPGLWAILPVSGAALIIYSGPQAWLNRKVLSHPIAVWFGLISYPLYLWHWPLLSFARILENETPSRLARLLIILISIALAWLTYRLVERPIRFATRRTQQITTIFLCTSVFVLAVFGSWVYFQHGLPDRLVATASAQSAEYVSMDAPPESSCNQLGVSSAVLPFCTLYASPKASKTVVLWGDSTVLSWLPVFLTVAKEQNFTIVKISHFSCPPIVGARKTAFGYAASKEYCADGQLQQTVLGAIAKIRPDSIVLMSAWSAYGSKEFVTDRPNELASLATTERVLQVNLPQTIDQLSQIADTLIFKSWPVLPRNPNVRVIPFLYRNTHQVTLDQTAFDFSASRINTVFSHIRSPRVTFYDPAPRVCDGMLCHAEREGVHLYTDTYHLSPQGALWFKPDIERLLNAY